MKQLNNDIYDYITFNTETNCIAEYIIYSCIYDYEIMQTYAG
jgi:hypothetical protein